MPNPSDKITDNFINDIRVRLENNQPVRRSLPIWGRVHIDRSLPFLCVYRKMTDCKSLGIERLVMGEASYIKASANSSVQKSLASLVQSIARSEADNFGSFLILEIWELREDEISTAGPIYQPYFQIIRPRKTPLDSTIETLEADLKKVKYRGHSAGVDIISASKICPPGLAPLISVAKAAELSCHILGLRVRPIYRNHLTGETFPLVRRSLNRRISAPLKRAFHEFIRVHTTHRPSHYMALGRKSVVKAVWEVDEALAAISNQFDFLLQITPINTDAAWAGFKKNRFQKDPVLIYRRMPIDPILAKRNLFKVPIEHIEDPVLADLFRSQQMELDRKLTMLADRGTVRFRYGSVQLYGVISDELLTTSREILTQISPHTHGEAENKSLDAASFAAMATKELDRLRKLAPEMKSEVEISDEVSGLIVSNGNLLIGRRTNIPLSRARGLLQHEIGTHILTYVNGRSQPFQQLYIGLSGYDELQEGLAVLAEFLVGGLNAARLRLLAARVLASDMMLDGASFIDVFRELNETYSFNQKSAYSISVRIFRGGGLTKDAVYLRGLIELLKYLQDGGDHEILFVGKFDFKHVSLIRELLLRKVLKPAPLRPSYLTDPTSVARMERVRNGLSVHDLVSC